MTILNPSQPRPAGSVYGSHLRPAGKRPKIYARGRVCALEGCETVLSSYNPAARCCLHEHVKTKHERGRCYTHHTTPRQAVCATCGEGFETHAHHALYCSDKCRWRAYKASHSRRKGAAT